MRIVKYLFFFGILITILAACSYWRTADFFFEKYYDFKSNQKPVENKKEIEKQLSKLKKISFEELDKNYLKATDSGEKKYKKMLSGKVYYKIHRADFYKFICNDFRVKDLLAKDGFYKKCLWSSSKKYYWLIDEKLIFKLFDLQKELKNKGLNPNGFSIVNGHRHPKYNTKVGGASKSRHVVGEAVDLYIKDVDGNRKYEPKDKEIILEILENKIIKSSGGIGKYPGTRSVHFDVRGHKARWDSYKRQ